MITVVLKNYRVFADQSPLAIELGPQFTALVGPNNSGKSALLFALYELRNLWEQIPQNLPAAVNNPHSHSMQVTYAGVEDPVELFHNQNDRPITVEISVEKAEGGGPAKRVDRVVLTCRRATPNSWSMVVHADGAPLGRLRSPNGGFYQAGLNRSDRLIQIGDSIV